MSDEGCAAIILAAGASTRLGQPKQLVPIEGEPLLLRTVRMAREADCAPILAVLGHESERIRVLLAGLSVVPVVNLDWPEGMGSSLRCSITMLAHIDPLPPAVLLLVCDQIALTAQFLRELRRAHASSRAGIAASRYAGRAGVPAIFSSRYYPELREAGGDRGARDVLQRYAADVELIDFVDGDKDLDTPDELRELQQSRQRLL